MRDLVAPAVILGILTLGPAETAAAEVLLAAFISSMLIVFAVDVLDHAGSRHEADHLS